MHKYFTLDTVAVFDEPEAPAKPVDKSASKGAKPASALKVRLERNHRQQDLYYKEFNVYQHKKKDWDEFNKVDNKLRKQILTTVVPQKKATLCGVYIVRKWLTNLQATTSLLLENMH